VLTFRYPSRAPSTSAPPRSTSAHEEHRRRSVIGDSFGHRGRTRQYYNIYGNGTGGENTKSMNVEISDANVVFKNNIVAEANGQELTIPVNTVNTLSFDNNDFYHSAGGRFMTHQGSDYSFADWERDSREDASSISADPKFHDAAAHDFRLTSGSPAIAAGMNLGSPYQMALDPMTSFPYGIAVQNNYGSSLEIGAFVYNHSSN